MVFKHFADPSVPAPSSALRMSINTGPGAFYGEKYKVDKAIYFSQFLRPQTTDWAIKP
jgi:hypothetical protein